MTLKEGVRFVDLFKQKVAKYLFKKKKKTDFLKNLAFVFVKNKTKKTVELHNKLEIWLAFLEITTVYFVKVIVNAQVEFKARLDSAIIYFFFT